MSLPVNRRATSGSQDVTIELARMREELDTLDLRVLMLLEERADIAWSMAQVARRHDGTADAPRTECDLPQLLDRSHRVLTNASIQRLCELVSEATSADPAQRIEHFETYRRR